MSLTLRKKIRRFFLGILLWLLAIVMLIPFFLIVWNSFKNKADANLMNFSWPQQFHPEKYVATKPLQDGTIPLKECSLPQVSFFLLKNII